MNVAQPATRRDELAARHEASHTVGFWILLGPSGVGETTIEPGEDSRGRRTGGHALRGDLPEDANPADLAVALIAPLADSLANSADAGPLADSDYDFENVGGIAEIAYWAADPSERDADFEEDWTSRVFDRARKLVRQSRFIILRRALERQLAAQRTLARDQVLSILANAEPTSREQLAERDAGATLASLEE